MPAKRLTMRTIREILRLRYEVKLSYRGIQQALNIGYGTVVDYLQRATAAGVEWPLPDTMDEQKPRGQDQVPGPIVNQASVSPSHSVSSPVHEVIHSQEQALYSRNTGSSAQHPWVIALSKALPPSVCNPPTLKIWPPQQVSYRHQAAGVGLTMPSVELPSFCDLGSGFYSDPKLSG